MKPTNTHCMLNEVFSVTVGSIYRNPVLLESSALCWNLVTTASKSKLNICVMQNNKFKTTLLATT